MWTRGTIVLGLLSWAIPASASGTKLALTLNVPGTVTGDASPIVDRDFLGLAFEESSFVRYATDTSGGVNAFTKNLMQSIYSRTGGKPIMRLGGTSPDYAHYLPGQKEPALPVAEQNNYQNIGFTTIGPSYWQLTKLFPEAKFMVQVPLANRNISEAVEWAKAAVAGIGMEQIHSIQIGNEPDAYNNDFHGEGGVFLGPPKFQGKLTNQTYVGNYTQYANAIRNVLALPTRFFTAFDVGQQVSNPAATGWLYDVKTCFDLGIDKNQIIKEVAHHYYQNQAGGRDDLKTGLMTMSVTHTNLDYYRKHINWLRVNRPKIPFILNEIGNSLKSTNSYEYQARLGSALWQVDFYLYSLWIGVARFNYQELMHAGYNMWLPVASASQPAQVFSNYYSQPFLADFVGTSGKTRVAKIAVGNPSAAPNLAAYAAYEDGQVKRVVVANLDYWFDGVSTIARPFVELSLSVPSTTKSVTVTYLTSTQGAGAEAGTMSYADSQWTYASAGLEVKGVTKYTKTIVVTNGAVKINVNSSEAALVYLNTT